MVKVILPEFSEINEASFAMFEERNKNDESRNSSVDFKESDDVGSWCSIATFELNTFDISETFIRHF